jgi:hypothetical protein
LRPYGDQERPSRTGNPLWSSIARRMI